MKRNAGTALVCANRVQDAYEAFQDSLALVEKQIPTSNDPNQFHDDIAFNYGSLAYALIGMGRLDEAWDAAAKSTELLKQTYSLVSPRIGEYDLSLPLPP